MADKIDTPPHPHCRRPLLSRKNHNLNWHHVGASFIGHEFHHSEIVDIPEDTTFAIGLERGTGIKGELDGILVKNTLAAYAHLHAASYTDFAKSFVDFCSKRP